MNRLNGQFAVAATAALSILFLLSLLALLAWVLWQPSNVTASTLISVRWLIGFNVICLAVVTSLACYLTRRDHARNGKSGD